MLIHGNSFRIPLKDNSIHGTISSFPYWGLRSYGLQPMIFGGSSDCRHEWKFVVKHRTTGGPQVPDNKWSKTSVAEAQQDTESQFCHHCNAWRGSFGLEPTMALHIQNAVLVCREIKRVLRPDGIFWLNYGDSFATSRNGRSAAAGKALGNDDRTFRDKPFSTADELPAKNLCMIPQRVAIALQADGWIVRAAPQWIKRNAMPESVRDRPGNAHEYIFMLVKSERYYYDGEAVRKPGKEYSGQAGTFNRTNGKMAHLDIPGQSYPSHRDRSDRVPSGRALRTSDFFFDSLDSYINHLTYIRDNGGLLLDSEGMPEAFIVNPQPYKFAHYATFPPALVAPMIQVLPEKVCSKCGAPWKRVIEKTGHINKREPAHVPNSSPTKVDSTGWQPTTKATNQWQPSCKCPDNEPVAAVILDPFAGSGTVGQVARELGRAFIGIDLNPKYLSENALPRSERKTSESALNQLPLFSQLLEQAA